MRHDAYGYGELLRKERNLKESHQTDVDSSTLFFKQKITYHIEPLVN